MSEVDDLAEVFGHLWGLENGRILTFHAFDDTHKLATANKLEQQQARIVHIIGQT